MHMIAANSVCFGEALIAEGFLLVSGDTDNHLALVGVTPKVISCKKAERLLGEVGITVNNNAIPFDPKTPTIASGVRISTPVVTSRGMGEEEMNGIASLMTRAPANLEEDEDGKAKLKTVVEELAAAYPLYPDLVG